MNTVDGTLIAAGGFYAMNALMERYPDVQEYAKVALNQKAEKLFEKLRTQCIADSILTAGFVKSETLTTDGKSFYDHTKRKNAVNRRLTEQLRTALRKPSVPALVIANPFDDIVGSPQMKSSADTWCRKGGKIKFVRYIFEGRRAGNGLSHMVPALRATDYAIDYMVDGFNGTLPTTCTVSVAN